MPLSDWLVYVIVGYIGLVGALRYRARQAR